MANKQNVVDENILSTPLSKSAQTAILDRVNNSNELLQKKQFGLTPEEIDLHNRQIKALNTVESRVNAIFRSHTGSGNKNSQNTSNETIDSMLSIANTEYGAKGRSKSLDKRTKEAIEKAQKEILDLNKTFLNNMLETNKKNFQENLTTYNLIMKIIPKMRMVMKTFVNTIISPDDFTKSSLNIVLDQNGLSPEVLDEVRERIYSMVDGYGIDKNLSEDVMAYLRDGKLFFIVRSMNDEIKRMLVESGEQGESGVLDYKKFQSELVTIKDKNLFKNDSFNESVRSASFDNKTSHIIKSLNESFGVPENDFKAIDSAVTNIEKYISESFIIGNSLHLLEEHESFLAEDDNSITEFFGMVAGNNSSTSVPKAGEKYKSKEKLTDKEKEAIKKSNLDGREYALFKRVSAGNIVPLEYENNILGYIYLDIVEYDPDGTVIPSDKSDSSTQTSSFLNANASGAGNILQNMVYAGKEEPSSYDKSGKTKVENPNGTNGLSAADDARLMFIAKTFTNQLSAKTNIKLLKKSTQLKTAIYNTLAIRKISSNEKIRIVYLKPEEVVYIDRGQSIFDNILFFAKLYITSLLTLLMQNVLRGSPKRIAYVEVGLDNNAANSVNQVIRDMRSKDITSVQNMDIQSLLNIVGDYQDLYIPVIDGEKPIIFDQLESQEAQSLDNDFLNWLSNNIFSSLLPASYLTEVENVDFAKSLSMQNSRFLRDIVGDQKILSEGYTTLIRRLYDLNIKSNEDEEEKTAQSERIKENTNTSITADEFIVQNIEVLFPSPSSLNLTNITDQISNAGQVVDTIIESLKVDEITTDEEEDFKKQVKTELMSQYVPTMDWAGYNDVVEKIKREFIFKRISSKLNDDPDAMDNPEDGDL